MLSQITRDDTWVQQQIENKVMDPDQARRSSYAHLLTQCLGLDEAPHPQVFSGQSAPGDTYLLCTDGLVGMLQDKELAAILSENFRSAETAEDQCAKALTAMLEAANEASGRDNILGSNDSVRLAVSQTGRVMRSRTCSAATSRRSNVKTLRTRAVA